MAVAYLDTQILVWIVSMKHELLTCEVRRVINASALLISPMVTLELKYLNEVGRLRMDAKDVVDKLRAEIGLSTCSKSFPDVIGLAMNEGWTRDPFDRVIVAQAKSNGVAPLITADEKIRANYVNAVW